jgi:outer membrane murein-binding lipoprotein Lpp
MNQYRFLFVAGALVGAAVAGCASDSGMTVREAYLQEFAAKREAREQAAEVERARAEGQAGREQNAQEASADWRYGGSATGDRVVAESKMTEERKKYRAQIDERVKKLDARTAELRAKLGQAGPKATTEARDGVDAILSQRELVWRETNGLSAIKDDGWASAKKSMNTRVDELEAIVKQAADKVEKK